MNEQFTGWWRMRTLREQRLLLVMAALLAIVIVWLGIIRPVDDALVAARDRHDAAVTTLAETRAAAEAVALLEKRAPQALGATLDTYLTQAAGEAGFTSASVSSQGNSRVALIIPAVRPAAFFSWLRGLETRGIVVERLSAKANSDPTLAIDATLVGRGG